MTKEQEAFILNNADMSISKLRKVFNEKFGTEYKDSIFYYHTKRLGVKKFSMHKYTKEEDDFLKNNAPKMTREELTNAFSEKFLADIDVQAIEVRCWKYGYGRSSDGKFHKGDVPWCKTQGGRSQYIKALKGGNSGSFKKGNIPPKVNPVGKIVKTTQGNFIKTENGMKRLSVKIWEDANGKIPKGLKLVSVNGNPNETCIDNMRLVNNNVHVYLISNKWHDKGAEIFDTGTKYAELCMLLKGK